MNVETIRMDPRIARIHYLDYRKRCRVNREKRAEALAKKAVELDKDVTRVRLERSRIEREDEELLKAYRALYRGQQIIDLVKVIGAGGLDSQKLPKLAAIRADHEKCHLLISGGTVLFSPNWRYGTSDREKGSGAFRVSKHLPRELSDSGLRNQSSWPNRAEAIVPTVPPQLRPDDLSKYFILWEAEWTAKAPVDPLLLSKVNETLWAVVAQWDLTPLEQRVLEGRL